MTFASLRFRTASQRAALLDSLAAAATHERNTIISTCSEETALTPAELAPEFDRMVGTLKMFADLVREGSWVRAAIDTKAEPGRSIGPGHDIRSMLVPLGPVAVFGASNFPLAYGVLGGDTASALAAGCPVVVKEHPAHPKTGRLLAEIARKTVSDDEDLAELITYVPNPDPTDHTIAEALVSRREIRAVGFTGSREGGMALDALARKRWDPIPVFAEMSSINAVVVMPKACKSRGEAIGVEIAESMLARVGQQCTCPGLVFLWGGPSSDALVASMRARLERAEQRTMLTPRICENYEHAIEAVAKTPNAKLWRPGGTDGPPDGRPALIEVDSRGFEEGKARAVEMFGPAVVVVRSGGPEEPPDWWKYDSFRFSCFVRPMLALSVYADAADLEDKYGSTAELEEFGKLFSLNIAEHAGRITFNTVPTGVRVATAMVHGGPFPATNAPHTTAVGPRAIERWCRPVCFQNCPDALLPDELKNANPRGIWRTVNGVPMREAL
ncbi:MAG: aldehyde dehydrogenase family protein [Phycisphaerales bacterium]|nr:aldehyde dehydrogenase family protein [Phycisphaerales bacterium]